MTVYSVCEFCGGVFWELGGKEVVVSFASGDSLNGTENNYTRSRPSSRALWWGEKSIKGPVIILLPFRIFVIFFVSVVFIFLLIFYSLFSYIKLIYYLSFPFL